jgi:hypothetical protein
MLHHSLLHQLSRLGATSLMAKALHRAIALITYEIYEARISVEIGGV